MVQKISIEINDKVRINVDGLNGGLKELCKLAEDSYSLEEILNDTIQSLYRALPDGEKNYQEDNPIIGRIWINRSDNEKGNLNLDYYPSQGYEEKFKYYKKTIGEIFLRQKTVSLRYTKKSDDTEYNEGYWELPKQLMKDTDTIIKILKLEKVERQ